MKKIIISIFLLGLLFAACKKEVMNVSEVVTVSYPTINLIGPAYVYVPLGSAYNDQGATLIDDITHVSSTISATSNPVDVNTPALYAVTFTAANKNGFKTTVVRTVLVLNYTPAAGLDTTLNLAGVYLRAATGIDVNVYKMALGLYIVDNFAGSSLVYPAYMITPTDSTINVPDQFSFGGFELSTTNDALSLAPGDTTFAYVVQAAGFGTSLRTFAKQ